MSEHGPIFSESDHEELWDESQEEFWRTGLKRLQQEFADEQTLLELDAELDARDIGPTL